jgi:hypothetical protein
VLSGATITLCTYNEYVEMYNKKERKKERKKEKVNK